MKSSTAIVAMLLVAQLALAAPLRQGRTLLETPIEQSTSDPAMRATNTNLLVTPNFPRVAIPKSARTDKTGSDSTGGDSSKPDGAMCGCIKVSDGTAGLTCYDFAGPIANSENVKCTARPCSKSPHYKCVDSGATDMCVVKIDEAVQLHALAPGICMPKVVTRKNVFLQLGSGLGGDSSNRDSSKSD
mmetsp:Transcript_22059/g.58764  ORF Transcript_22059/g.58764 Transcript_22059/m.58764 type:complete len:187 (+) Transcript_22059:72-632(+)